MAAENIRYSVLHYSEVYIFWSGVIFKSTPGLLKTYVRSTDED